MVFRILRALYIIGEFDHPVSGNINADVTSAEHNALTRKLSAESIVLLKNNDHLLPFSKTGLKQIAVFNPSAKQAIITGGGGSGSVGPKYQISVVDGISKVVGANAVKYYFGNDVNAAVALATASDVAVCVLATSSSEGGDRGNLKLKPNEISICSAVGYAQKKTVAVVISPGAVLTDWADNVTALVAAFMAGQEEGNAVADVLFGDVNPSGKLPVTLPNMDNEVGFKPDEYPGVNLQEYYREQLNVGYRWYLTHGVKPRFPFGFGLSYTQFSLSGLTLTGRQASVTLTNTGMAAGAEVVQLYVEFPKSAGEPPLQLKGFQKVLLNAKDTKTVQFNLLDRDLSIWDVTTHAWKIVPGTYVLHVGTSSEDLPLQVSLTA
jgi:beta-glucosidase